MITIQIRGLEQVVGNMDYGVLVEEPLRRFLLRSALTVESHAKENAPVDTGRLRASIASRVEQTQATISPSVFYAPYVEFGTRPHWPPMAALQPWAQRHGFPPGSPGAFLIARAISRHGTKPHPYMQPAALQSLSAIQGFAADLATEIENNWSAS